MLYLFCIIFISLNITPTAWLNESFKLQFRELVLEILKTVVSNCLPES